MAGSGQIHFSDDAIGDPNDLDDLIEAAGRDVSDASGDEEQGQRGSGGEDGEEERQGSGNDGENQTEDNKTVVEPKKKRVVGPRIILNTARLKGKRGLTALPKEFENFKFRGKGHELDDLERVLTRIEHWGHRLLPKLHFEDFIDKAEKLCSKKKEMQVYIDRIRMGLETGDDDLVIDEEQPEENVQNEALSEFDKLLDEQIAFYEANPRQPIGNRQTKATRPPTSAFVPKTAPTLTPEQKEIIARNKKAAMERRQARLKELEEEQLREATAASLASASLASASLASANERNVDGADFNEPVPVQEPSDNMDKSAEKRERAARNKQLALERLRARRLAAQGIVEPPPSLNISSSSDVAEPLSTSNSPASPRAPFVSSPERAEGTALSKKPATTANQCHEFDETNEAGVISHYPEKKNDGDGTVSPERKKSSKDLTSVSGKSAETEDVSPNLQREESATASDVTSSGREKSSKDLTSTSGKSAETKDVSPTLQIEESAIASAVTSPGKRKSVGDLRSSSEMLPETEEDISPSLQHEESAPESDLTTSGKEELPEIVHNEVCCDDTMKETEEFSSVQRNTPSLSSPEKMEVEEVDDRVASPKECLGDDAVLEKMDDTDGNEVFS